MMLWPRYCENREKFPVNFLQHEEAFTQQWISVIAAPLGPVDLFFFSHISTLFPASGQAVVTGVVPFSPPVLAFNFL